MSPVDPAARNAPAPHTPGKPPKLWGTRRARWMLNAYPPFLFQRIHVEEIAADFRFARLGVRRSLLNRNLNGTIFGGAISAAADPIHAILFWQALAREGVHAQAWTRSASVRFERPADCDLNLEFRLTPETVAAARAGLAEAGRYRERFEVPVLGRDGARRALVEVEIHLQGPESGAQRS